MEIKRGDFKIATPPQIRRCSISSPKLKSGFQYLLKDVDSDCECSLNLSLIREKRGSLKIYRDYSEAIRNANYKSVWQLSSQREKTVSELLPNLTRSIFSQSTITCRDILRARRTEFVNPHVNENDKFFPKH